MTRMLASTVLVLSTALSALAQAAPQAPAGAAALPPGPGKAIAQKMCQSCHGLEVVTAKRASPDDWASTVQLMVSRGADGTDEEIDTLTKYLAASFPAVKDGKSAPSTDSAPPPASTPAPSHFDSVDLRFLLPLLPLSR